MVSARRKSLDNRRCMSARPLKKYEARWYRRLLKKLAKREITESPPPQSWYEEDHEGLW